MNKLEKVIQEIKRLTEHPSWEDLAPLRKMLREIELGYHKLPEGANWSETVMSSGDLCLLVCHEHRLNTLEAKDCSGLDCELCQRNKQAEISFKAGADEEAKRGIERCLMTYDDGKKAGMRELNRIS